MNPSTSRLATVTAGAVAFAAMGLLQYTGLSDDLSVGLALAVFLGAFFGMRKLMQ
jgi:hypothetical protein